MTLASCPARQGQQRSLRRMCQVFELGVGPLGRGAQLGVGAVGGLLRGWFVPPPVGGEHRFSSADVALAGEHD